MLQVEKVAMIYKLGEQSATIEGGCFIAPTATVIGSVTLKVGVSIWFNVVIRGDNDRIHIGEGSNIQDGAVLHVDPGYPITIGRRVTVGHQAMLHGCTIGDGSLIGMNAVILNGATIGRGCLVGANALVTEKMVVPDGSVVLGSPGKIVRTLDEAARRALEDRALEYIEKIEWYRNQLTEVKGASENG